MIGRSGTASGLPGRVLGAAAALAATALWLVFLYWNPYSPQPPTDAELLFGMLIVGASALATVAAALGAHLAMYLLFFVLFVPAGVNAMGTAGIFQAIGYLDLVYLGAAVLVHRAVPKTERRASRTD